MIAECDTLYSVVVQCLYLVVECEAQPAVPQPQYDSKSPLKGLEIWTKTTQQWGDEQSNIDLQSFAGEWYHLEHITSNDKHVVCQQMRKFQPELSEQMSAQHETENSARPGNRSLLEQMSSNKFAEQVKM